MISRWRKILHISQAHLAPGMSLSRLQAIFDKRLIGRTWRGVPDETIDAIFTEIAGIVRQAKGINQ